MRELFSQRLQVSLHTRKEIGVNDRRRGAFVFLNLRQHVARRRYPQARKRLTQQVASMALVLGIDAGVEKAHGRRFDPFFHQTSTGGYNTCHIQWHHNFTIRAHPFNYLKAITTRYQRNGFIPGNIEHGRCSNAPDFQNIPKPLGGDQSSFSTLLLKDYVRANGCPMNHFSNV